VGLLQRDVTPVIGGQDLKGGAALSSAKHHSAALLQVFPDWFIFGIGESSFVQ